MHLTDLHFGLDRNGWLWPSVKDEFLRDVDHLSEHVEAWDLVFFTGDLTQKGNQDEFDRLNVELSEIWQVLSRRGTAPLLCVVPGNHDLLRPEPASSIAQALSKLWWSEQDIRSQFWEKPTCEYREAVRSFFAPYTRWLASPPVPTVARTEGILPGDFSATFLKGGLSFGIVGLNSTFLQVSEGEYEKRLDMHVSQLSGACGADYPKWLKEHSAAVLLTHQPSEWLHPQALDHFRQDIFPAGRFLAHFYGHLHDSQTTNVSEGGGQARRFRQGPSLFGLSNWSGAVPMTRSHGYTAGQFIFEDAGGLETYWPRTTVKTHDGGLCLAPDYRYRLQSGDCVISPFDWSRTTAVPHVATIPTETTATASTTSNVTDAILDNAPDEADARKRLTSCPRFPMTYGQQHRHVRLEEQSQFELELRKSRCIWITADWGTGKDPFVASSLVRLRDAAGELDVFHIQCGEATNVDELESLFPQQTGFMVQTFCSLLTSLRNPILVLDEMHPALYGKANEAQLKRLISAMLDYAPVVRIVFTSRTSPDTSTFPHLAIRPLEVPDVRAYLTHHLDASPELHEPDVIERIHGHSDGLPEHIDRILVALKVSSLTSVLEDESEGYLPIGADTENIPHSLMQVVSNLAKSDDQRSRRSLRLLKVLSVLSYGEPLEVLARFLPTEPFFNDNALQLSELALIDVINLYKAPSTDDYAGGSTEGTGPKIIKAPRQVRDCVQALTTDEERRRIVLAGIDRFFGRAWRDGKLKLRSVPMDYRGYLSSGPGNEFALVNQLIKRARHDGDSAEIRRAAQLGTAYVAHLKSVDRYRDAALVAEALVQKIDRDEFADEWARLAADVGSCLRMTKKRDEAMVYLKEALQFGEGSLTNDDQAGIWLGIALIEEANGAEDAAHRAAGEVVRLVGTNSAAGFQASVLMAGLANSGPERTRALVRLEKKARIQGYRATADNIAIDLASVSATARDKIGHLDRVLHGGSGGYNQARAIVAKAAAVRKSRGGSPLTDVDLRALAKSYSYLHSQRLGNLFNNSHDELWHVLENRNEPIQLLRLFRHSSFVWRIRGDEEHELKYLKRLQGRKADQAAPAQGGRLIVEVFYFLRRLKAVLSDAVAQTGGAKDEVVAGGASVEPDHSGRGGHSPGLPD